MVSFPTSLDSEADQAGGTANAVRMKLLSCCIPQAVAIHFEKVSRREIGAFTAPKPRIRAKHVTPPASGKEPMRSYSRVPILYSALDSIGHCFQVKDACFSMTEDDAILFLIRIYPVWQVSDPQPRQPAGTTDGVQRTTEAPVYVDRSFSVLIKSMFSQKNQYSRKLNAYQQGISAATLEMDRSYKTGPDKL